MTTTDINPAELNGGDAAREVLASLVEQSKSRSAVYDVITNTVPVELSIDAG